MGNPITRNIRNPIHIPIRIHIRITTMSYTVATPRMAIIPIRIHRLLFTVHTLNTAITMATNTTRLIEGSGLPQKLASHKELAE